VGIYEWKQMTPSTQDPTTSDQVYDKNGCFLWASWSQMQGVNSAPSASLYMKQLIFSGHLSSFEVKSVLKLLLSSFQCQGKGAALDFQVK
jgi:hypothetical protein